MRDPIHRAIVKTTLAALVAASLCLPGRAEAMGDPTGACCIPFDVCEVTTIEACFGDLGGVIWAPGQTCDTFSCPPLGACCLPDGTCRITSRSNCENTFGGVYRGDGVECRVVTCAPPCPGDLDGSGDVGFADLVSVLSTWGPCAACPQDIDGDGAVGFSDLLIVLSSWGPCA